LEESKNLTMKTEKRSIDRGTNDQKGCSVVEINNRSVTSKDLTLIQELLSAQVPLSQVVGLFRGRVEEKEVNAIAKRLVNTDTASRDAKNTQSALKDAEFLCSHIENVSRDTPDDLLDPLLQTIMHDPVVLSSGYVVDRSTVLNKAGKLKFRTCPWTGEPLQEKVYPLVEKARKLKEFNIGKLQNILHTASKVFKDQNLTDFFKLKSLGEVFIDDIIDDIGAETCKKFVLQLAELSLAAFEKAASVPGSIPPNEKTPKALSNILIRIYRGLPASRGDSTKNNEEELGRFQEVITLLEHKAREAIDKGKYDDAREWCDAYKNVSNSCGNVQKLKLARLFLDLGRKRGDGDLVDLQRCVYDEICHDSDSVQRFFDEEGIDLHDLRDLCPLFLSVQKITRRERNDDWHAGVQSDSLQGKVAKVMVAVGTFRDQGYGNHKSNLGLALYDSNDTLVSRCNIFGTYGSKSYKYKNSPYRILEVDEDVVSKAQPGFTYKLEYTVGGGGGHILHVEKWTCKIFYQGRKNDYSYPMKDAKGCHGIYMGEANDKKANGRGRLEYYDGDTIIGDFSDGCVVNGARYSNGGNSIVCTIINGKQTTVLDDRILFSFPIDANTKSLDN